MREIALGVILALIGAVWIAAIVTAVEADASPLRETATMISMASGPLALLGIVYLLIQRTSRREARRFGRTAAAMRAEAAGLEQVTAELSARIDANRNALAEHAHQLLLLGEDSAVRLGEISTGMRSETLLLRQQAELLEKAAATARGDMGALLTDLPRAENQMRELTALLRDAGLGAHERAGALEAQLASLAARGRDADEIAGGAAQRLAAHLARIEGTTDTASKRMESATALMSKAVESALGNAAEAVDETRRGIEAQSAAMLAMIEQAAAALHHAGADSSQSLTHRLDEISGRIDALSTRLKSQDAASQALLAGLDKGVADVEARFAELGESGAAETARLAESVGTLRALADGIDASLRSGDGAADALIARADLLKKALDASSAELDATLPAALARIEEQAGRSRATIAAITPEAVQLETTIASAAGRLGEADTAIGRQQAAFETVGRAAEERLAEIQGHAEALSTLIDNVSESAQLLTDSAGPRLVDALLRVRETAVQAAERARDSLATVIPEAAAALGAASSAAIDDVLGGRIEAQMASIATASERAVQAAHQATERLMRQMLTITDTTSAIETRIEEAKADNEKASEEAFSRRVALLIESLNSTAIDVAKILSNEVTDSAWSAYLKGDRGIFTRRAVRLLDTTEAREIARHYDAEPEFREQVNRYIHDFEGMLRRVLSSRDGALFGVTLLSSDMGKLYVALAQAIERLR